MVLISELVLLAVSIVLGQAFIPSLSTERNFVPSAWNGPSVSETGPINVSSRSSEATGRRYSGGTHQPKRSYGNKKVHYHKTEIAIDPPAIVLRCKIQEPLEHVVWIRSRCPGGYEHDDSLIAEGATVQDKSLYDVRILGGNSTISSELLIKKPLEPESSGLFRCEAWPHGGGGPPYGQYVANDIYVIGGKEMLRHCFGGWESPHEPLDFDSYHAGSKHRATESQKYGHRYTPNNDLRGSPSQKVEANTERTQTTTSKYPGKYQYPHIPVTRNRNRPEAQSREPEVEVSTQKPSLVRGSNNRPENPDKNTNSRFGEEKKPIYVDAGTSQSFEQLVKEYNKYLLQQQVSSVKTKTETQAQPQLEVKNEKRQTTPSPTTVTTLTTSTPSSVAPRNYIITAPPTQQRSVSRDPKPFVPSSQYPSFHRTHEEEPKSIETTTQRPGRTNGPIWDVDEIMSKNSFAKIDSRSSKALYGAEHGQGTIEKFEHSSTLIPPPSVIVVMAEKPEESKNESTVTNTPSL